MDGVVLYSSQGRRCGASNPKAKLTEEQVHRMRDLRAQGVTVPQLARHFSASPHTVRSICVGRRRNARVA